LLADSARTENEYRALTLNPEMSTEQDASAWIARLTALYAQRDALDLALTETENTGGPGDLKAAA
jgi:hypothetical protein